MTQTPEARETVELGRHKRHGVDAAEPETGEPLLRIEGLKTHFFTNEGVVKAVDGVDLTVPKGKTVCVVGESGCGKSITARSVLQLIDPPGKIIEGSVNWRQADGRTVDLAKLGSKSAEIRAVRGGEIGMVFQEPMASLSPLYTVGDQLSEAILLHQAMSKTAVKEHAISLLRRVGIPKPEQRFDSYPFQLSGGMCQRVMVAVALACEPALLIADEPTTALDVTTQARILDLLANVQEQSRMSMLFITHDLGVVAEIADEVVVMYLGTVVERGRVEDIFARPKHPYTQALLRSIPTMRGGGERQELTAIKGMVPHPLQRPTGCPFRTRCDHAIPDVCNAIDPPVVEFDAEQAARCHLYDQEGAAPVEELSIAKVSEPAVEPATRTVSDGPPLIEVSDLSMHFPFKQGFLGRGGGAVRAVDGVDLSIRQGETLGLVGESGCGKTTLGRCLIRVLRPTSGSINYRTVDGEVVDLAGLNSKAMAKYRSEIRMIFQDPFSSLNPRMTILDLVGEPLRTNRLAQGKQIREQVAEMLERVGLRPEFMNRYPHAFSGGERQRVNIARALITRPRVVIADEAVSALDVSVRAQILNLLADLQQDFDLTYLFVSHDLSVIEHLCDRVAVMYLGSLVETANTSTLFRSPHHPYTEALLNAVPKPDPAQRHDRGGHISDILPDPANPPPGCLFHTRCPYARESGCKDRIPDLRETADGHRAACHYTEELTLTGI